MSASSLRYQISQCDGVNIYKAATFTPSARSRRGRIDIDEFSFPFNLNWNIKWKLRKAHGTATMGADLGPKQSLKAPGVSAVRDRRA
jgi:hypothetical protein